MERKKELMMSAKEVEMKEKTHLLFDKIALITDHLKGILNDNRSTRFETIFELCVYICKYKGGDLLLKSLEMTVSSWLLAKLLSSHVDGHEVCRIFQDFTDKVFIMRKRIMYFETNYFIKKEERTLVEWANEQFSNIYLSDSLSPLLLDEIKTLFKNYRLKHHCDLKHLANLISLIVF